MAATSTYLGYPIQTLGTGTGTYMYDTYDTYRTVHNDFQVAIEASLPKAKPSFEDELQDEIDDWLSIFN